MPPRSRFSEELDAELRTTAFTWLTERTLDGAIPIEGDELASFRFHGERIPLKDPQRGIRKPKHLDAALSFLTTFRPPGQERPYEDGIGRDGLIRYKWQGIDPNHHDNIALRNALERNLPLIWFHGVAIGLFQAILPVYLHHEEPGERQFAFTLDGLQPFISTSGQESTLQKAYVERMVRQRVHQPVFRSMVLVAYKQQCAVCRLRHRDLLDAAHIVPDREIDGVPSIPNGLSLCKIHHAAYDKGIMGIDPDLRVHIREDILNEIDGPMLRHGIQEHHLQQLMAVPTHTRDRPDTELLEYQWRRFRFAS